MPYTCIDLRCIDILNSQNLCYEKKFRDSIYINRVIKVISIKKKFYPLDPSSNLHLIPNPEPYLTHVAPTTPTCGTALASSSATSPPPAIATPDATTSVIRHLLHRCLPFLPVFGISLPSDPPPHTAAHLHPSLSTRLPTLPTTNH